ncbi:lipocalin-like domain-containing protein [Nocardia sp. NPDC058519]|uniref:lipocalin-like domain-containing protein n=1 Tax=Nocardia sp. NPDC058519 TaxID=3346535 RepID=UPI00364A9093
MFISRSQRSRRPGLIRVLVAGLAIALSISVSGQAAAQTPAQFVAENESSHSKQMEWWYVTAHLKGKDPSGNVREYGIQSTLFKNHPAWGLDGYAHHMAVTDLQRGTYRAERQDDRAGRERAVDDTDRLVEELAQMVEDVIQVVALVFAIDGVVLHQGDQRIEHGPADPAELGPEATLLVHPARLRGHLELGGIGARRLPRTWARTSASTTSGCSCQVRYVLSRPPISRETVLNGLADQIGALAGHGGQGAGR